MAEGAIVSGAQTPAEALAATGRCWCCDREALVLRAGTACLRAGGMVCSRQGCWCDVIKFPDDFRLLLAGCGGRAGARGLVIFGGMFDA
jgi:hypothetical protein